jgi:insulysin
VWPIQVPNPNNVNSACHYYCQVGDITDDMLRCRLALFCHIAEEPIFSILRTKEQLGYSMWSGPRTWAGSMGFYILLQGEKSPIFIETRMEACLDHLGSILESMSDEAFETSRRGLIGKQLEKPKNLYQETSRYWAHMRDGSYDFDRREWLLIWDERRS